MTYILYARKGWGSAIAEAAFEVAKQPYLLASPEGDAVSNIRPLEEIAPLAQFPTIICPDGMVMTESAAILFHLDDIAPEANLVPGKDAPQRRLFLRLVSFISGALYPTFTTADFPERYVSSQKARDELVDSSIEKRKALWRQFEDLLGSGPYVLGAQFSGLDIYAAIMTLWGPGSAWFQENCPKLWAAAVAARKIPEIKKVTDRNFTNK